MESSDRQSNADDFLESIDNFIQSVYNDVGMSSPPAPASTSIEMRRSHPYLSPRADNANISIGNNITDSSGSDRSPNVSRNRNRRINSSPLESRRNLDEITATLNRTRVLLNEFRSDLSAANNDISVRLAIPSDPGNVASFVDLSETQETTPQPLRSLSARSRQQMHQSSDIDDDDVVVVASTVPPVIDLCTPNYENTTRRRPTVSRSRLPRRVLNPSGEEASVQCGTDCVTVPLAVDVTASEGQNKTTSTACHHFICAICMDSCTGRRPVTTKCGHIYCEDCIKQAIRTTHKCPLCSKRIVEKQLIRLYP